MQIIYDSKDAAIDIKEKMSTLSTDSIISTNKETEMLKTETSNGVGDNSQDVIESKETLSPQDKQQIEDSNKSNGIDSTQDEKIKAIFDDIVALKNGFCDTLNKVTGDIEEASKPEIDDNVVVKHETITERNNDKPNEIIGQQNITLKPVIKELLEISTSVGVTQEHNEVDTPNHGKSTFSFDDKDTDLAIDSNTESGKSSVELCKVTTVDETCENFEIEPGRGKNYSEEIFTKDVASTSRSKDNVEEMDELKFDHKKSKDTAEEIILSATSTSMEVDTEMNEKTISEDIFKTENTTVNYINAMEIEELECSKDINLIIKEMDVTQKDQNGVGVVIDTETSVTCPRGSDTSDLVSSEPNLKDEGDDILIKDNDKIVMSYSITHFPADDEVTSIANAHDENKENELEEIKTNVPKKVLDSVVTDREIDKIEGSILAVDIPLEAKETSKACVLVENLEESSKSIVEGMGNILTKENKDKTEEFDSAVGIPSCEEISGVSDKNKEDSSKTTVEEGHEDILAMVSDLVVDIPSCVKETSVAEACVPNNNEEDSNITTAGDGHENSFSKESDSVVVISPGSEDTSVTCVSDKNDKDSSETSADRRCDDLLSNKDEDNIEVADSSVSEIEISVPEQRESGKSNTIEGRDDVLIKGSKDKIVSSEAVPDSHVGDISTTTDESMDVIEVKEDTEEMKDTNKNNEALSKKPKTISLRSRLSNTLDILSDDEDNESAQKLKETDVKQKTENQCIDIEDDDDIMLIDEESAKDPKKPESELNTEPLNEGTKQETEGNHDTSAELKHEEINKMDTDEDSDKMPKIAESLQTPLIDEKKEVNLEEKRVPLVPDIFFTTYKNNLADMTRDDLEEFCIIKIVESIIDRSSLNEIKTKLKSMASSLEEHKKKAMMLTKQNRDLQVVLKSIQEEQKKGLSGAITPLKITRSVGMQVLLCDKVVKRKPVTGATNTVANTPPVNTIQTRQVRPVNQNTRSQKQSNQQNIPVPRLVPAPVNATNKNTTVVAGPSKNSSPLQNGIKVPIPAQKPEKRPRVQSVTVDLTDDEPPSKVVNKGSPTPVPVRVVPSQVLTPRAQFHQIGSPRKVFIPISGPSTKNTVMLKTVSAPGPRYRGAPMVRSPNNTVRIQKGQTNRHPAPLPEVMKQYQPPNWKALPPAPDLKLSKVENGIVISWKIEGYLADSYEEIASYQLYAYQETTVPPNSSLWKKIGDVKALPLPMACTLTQFMAGYKYYFAVRAVDVRSRLGPFSLPGSILLLNKI